MTAWKLIITGTDPDTGEAVREVYEVTPAPAAGSERAVLAQLVTGIHPDAVERSYEDGTATFAEGGGTITACFEIDGVPARPPAPPRQGSLFDA